jgi:hypothetical protein
MAKRQKNRQHSGQETEEQTTQWPRDRRTDNTVAKRQKNRQHSGQETEEQTTQWPRDRRTDNTMTKRQKNRQHNGQEKINKKTNNDLQNITQKTKDFSFCI